MLNGKTRLVKRTDTVLFDFVLLAVARAKDKTRRVLIDMSAESNPRGHRISTNRHQDIVCLQLYSSLACARQRGSL
jgi:hypothetical protein